LKQDILVSVSNLRKEFSNFKIQLKNAKDEHNKLNEEFKNANDEMARRDIQSGRQVMPSRYHMQLSAKTAVQLV